MADRHVLVLNNTGEFHDVIYWHDAMCLICRDRDGKSVARIHEYFDDATIGTIHGPQPCPSVVMLNSYVYIPFDKKVALNKANVLARDEYSCQYCGKKLSGSSGTIDHILPQNPRDSRRPNGQTKWKNVVAACKACNCRKDNRTPQEAGMKLLRRPFVPTSEMFFAHFLRKPEYQCWRPYFVAVESVAS